MVASRLGIGNALSTMILSRGDIDVRASKWMWFKIESRNSSYAKSFITIKINVLIVWH